MHGFIYLLSTQNHLNKTAMLMVIPELHFAFQIVFSQSSVINPHNEFPLGNQFSHMALALQVAPHLVWVVGMQVLLHGFPLNTISLFLMLVVCYLGWGRDVCVWGGINHHFSLLYLSFLYELKDVWNALQITRWLSSML